MYKNNYPKIIIKKEDDCGMYDDIVSYEIPKNIYKRKLSESQQIANDISLDCLGKRFNEELLNKDNNKLSNKDNNKYQLKTINNSKNKISKIFKKISLNIENELSEHELAEHDIVENDKYPKILMDSFITFANNCVLYLKDVKYNKHNKTHPLKCGDDYINSSIMQMDLNNKNKQTSIIDLLHECAD
jgi:hypothetical protein